MLKRSENQSQSHDKFSLELEIERIQRDLLHSTQETQTYKDQNVSLQNQISKFQAAISNLVCFYSLYFCLKSPISISLLLLQLAHHSPWFLSGSIGLEIRERRIVG
jgi:uncharacterized protein YjaG (DUF416 family)